MTVFDYVALGIVSCSVLLSVFRGAVREVLALVSWIVAFLVAQYYATAVEPLLPAAIHSPSLRLLAAFAAVFVATLLGMSLVTMGVAALVRKAGLGLADRLLGAVFGLARGALVVLVGVLLAGLTALPREAAWRNAMLSPTFEALALAVKARLPNELGQRIRYD